MNPVTDMWVCTQCGESNILERLNCYSCLSFKPGPRTPPGPRPESPTDLPNGETAPRKTTWPCKTCKSMNSYKCTECYLCEMPRPPSSRQSDTPSSRQSDPPTPSTEEFDWFCKLCRTQNFARRENCYTCNAFKESSNIAAPSAPDVEYWRCSHCSYKTSHGPHCFQCGVGKNPTVRPCPENWKCIKCEVVNFGKRTQCYSCHKKRKTRSSSPLPVTCPTCKFCNDPSSKECLLCGTVLPIPSQTTPRKDTPPKKRKMTKPPKNSNSSTLVPKETRLLITPDDWKCQSCDYKNIALRNFCKDCDSPRKCIAKLYIKYKKNGISALQNLSQDQALLSNCKKCNKSFPGTGNLCLKCKNIDEVSLENGPSISESSTTSAIAVDEGDSLMVKKCAKCGSQSNGQYCYNCANDMGIRLESDTWECQNCHLVDENTAICTGCGHNKDEVKLAALNFLTCKHCKTKNHSHKTHCVRCLKGLTAENLPVHAVRTASPESWRCMFCEIAVLANSTHCRGCNRARSNAEKRERCQDEVDTYSEERRGPYRRADEVEEGEYVEDMSHIDVDYYKEDSYSEHYYPPAMSHRNSRPHPRHPPPRPRAHVPASVRLHIRPPLPRLPPHQRTRPGARPRLQPPRPRLQPPRLPAHRLRPRAPVLSPRPRAPVPSPRLRAPIPSPRPRIPSPNKQSPLLRRQPINMMAPNTI